MLTPQQQATLRAYVEAQPELMDQPHNTDGAFIAALALNQVDPSGYYVWKYSTDTATLMDAITWANLTPQDTADGTATYTNRALACQAKQLNLQILLQGRESLATGRSSVRAGLTDALTNVPAGAGGALLDAGWLGAGKVKASITRRATVLEKLFAAGSGTTGSPSTMAVESPISYPEVQAAMGW